MWIVLELYNDGLTPTITKHKAKSEAITYIESQGYEMDSAFEWKTENCTAYEMDLHTCFLFAPEKISLNRGIK